MVMGKERAQTGGKEFGKVALWDVEAVLSPCQECNSHAAGIPSRSIPLAVRLLLRRDTTRRDVPTWLPLTTVHESKTTFPTYVRIKGQATRLNTARP